VISRGEIEQLEATVHSRVTSLGAAGIMRVDRPLHLTANVRELLDQA
jgi:hypothetical protein